MLNNNHHNHCAFAEQIVSYLYGETNAAFDAHLNNCSTCADELAGFGFVRSSIVEWKKAEFSNLETPSINIPYPTTVSTEKQSWLAELRRLFALSPTWATVSAALAIIVVFVGLTFFGLNFSKKMEVAENANKPINSDVSPIIETKTEPPIEKISNDTAEQTLEDKPSKPSEAKNESRKIAPKNQIVKTSDNPNKVLPNSNNSANVRKIKDDKNTLATQKRVLKLNNLEEEEDNSLRLADLFADVEGK